MIAFRAKIYYLPLFVFIIWFVIFMIFFCDVFYAFCLKRPLWKSEKKISLNLLEMYTGTEPIRLHYIHFQRIVFSLFECYFNGDNSILMVYHLKAVHYDPILHVLKLFYGHQIELLNGIKTYNQIGCWARINDAKHIFFSPAQMKLVADSRQPAAHHH